MNVKSMNSKCVAQYLTVLVAPTYFIINDGTNDKTNQNKVFMTFNANGQI